jgi:osmoprotectant transport system substrate-binding protein
VGVSGNFSESKIVAEMYAQALAGAGYTTSCQCDLASRTVSDAALFGGQIDMKPEYLATEAQFLNKSADVTGDPAHDSDVLKPLLQAKGVTVLNYASAVDTNAFVVTKETASKYGLTKVSDLAKSA